MGERFNGTCLCGACRFTAEPVEEGAAICHCDMCKKWSGGMFVAVDCGTSVVWEDADAVTRYHGSPWGERVFCATCGASMMWQTQTGEHQHVSVQCFDDPGRFPLAMQIYIDRKPASYTLANETAQMTAAEVEAMFAAQSETQT